MSMKTAGIIRIVAGALVAIVLIVILYSVLNGELTYMGDLSVLHLGAGKAAGENAVSASDGSAAVADVREIDVNWVAGSVTVQAGTGSEILFAETCARKLDEKQTMRFGVADGKLSIRYSGENVGILSGFEMPAKDLVITLPAGYAPEELDVTTISADLRIEGVTAREIDLETTSGRIEAEDMVGAEKIDMTSVSGEIDAAGIKTDELDVGSTSGAVDLSGEARRVEAGAVSGELRLRFPVQPEELEAETVSGRITVALPEGGADFTARLDSVSGNARCDFAAMQDGERITVGGGKAEFRFHTVSGDVRIEKLG